jgi:DNA-binding transcriptional LysR family regulator
VELMRVDLNLLVALDALLVERNVTRAAARMSVGQSAMSASLARLRRIFDDAILVREGRGLVMTPFAESIVEPLREALAQVERVVNGRPTFDPATERRTFSIIATDYISLVFLHPLLARLAREAPQVELRFFPVAADAADRLQRNEVDLLIHPLEILTDPGRFEHEVLIRDRHVVLADRANDRVRDVFTKTDLRSHPYLATTIADRPSYGEIQLERLGFETNRVIVASSVLAPWLIRGTQMVTVIHEHLAQYADAQVGMRLLDPPVPLEPVTEAMLWLPRHTHDPAHLWLRETLIDVIQTFDIFRWDWKKSVPFTG